jgi:hypothetical protein
MHLSDTPVTLGEEGDQAQPPIWLCRSCWVVVPVKGERLHIVRPASQAARPDARHPGGPNRLGAAARK